MLGSDHWTDGVNGFFFKPLPEKLCLPPSSVGKRHIYITKRAVLPAMTDQIDSHSLSCLVLKAVDRSRNPAGSAYKFLTAE